ncbi:MAG TPA: hypothetical protein VFL91_13915 [Thermomicrobiales bacterium]|nr:hypothetical protein [Thermomicrobiales bacterium]
MRTARAATLPVILSLVLSGLLLAVPAARAADAACFPETGHCLQGRFLAYWQAHGGLALNGYPLSDERQERLEDGKVYTVQYFERVRMEYHPENQPPYDVELGQFGRYRLRTSRIDNPGAAAPVQPQPGQAYFQATGHNVAPDFYAYWQANGGLAQFGYPLSEEFPQLLDDGKTYAVQYFERARFERHPENAGTPYSILLGQFGRQVLTAGELLAGEPSFDALYRSTLGVQAQIGRPSGPALHGPGAYQGFQRGAMIWLGNSRQIYVLCGGLQTGQVLSGIRGYNYFVDSWNEGDDPGGKPGPQPGLYEPKRGFGIVWRENQRVRDCLGYATTADETGYTGTVQQFVRSFGGAPNLLLSATAPEGRFIYAIYLERPAGGCTSADPCLQYLYERYPDPAQ